MLHFTSRAEWEAGRKSGEYRPAGLAEEGFVHLSFGHQLARAATEHARGALDLVLLVIDPSGLEAHLRIEGGFPHLYHPVPVSSVRLVVDLHPEDDGSFLLPETARLAELALVAQPSAEHALARVRAVMTGFDRPWWLAGGWATDAGHRTPTRPHLDLDIAVLRRDFRALGHHLADWDLRIPGQGQLRAWVSEDLPAGEHQIWARPSDGSRPGRWQDFGADPGFVEFLAEEIDDRGWWVFRRDPAVRAPLNRLGPPRGLLSPEVALLYKAKGAGGPDPALASKCQFDFEAALVHLGPDQRTWLHEALGRLDPGHPWLSRLPG